MTSRQCWMSGINNSESEISPSESARRPVETEVNSVMNEEPVPGDGSYPSPANLHGKAEQNTERCKTMHPFHEGITLPARAPRGELVPVPGAPVELAAAPTTAKDTGSAPVPQRYRSAVSRNGISQQLQSPSHP